MNVTQLKAVCNPVLEVLFTEKWGHKEQLLIQGHGLTVDESNREQPVIVVSLRKDAEGNDGFLQRWNNTTWGGVKIVVEIRPIARM